MIGVVGDNSFARLANAICRNILRNLRNGFGYRRINNEPCGADHVVDYDLDIWSVHAYGEKCFLEGFEAGQELSGVSEGC